MLDKLNGEALNAEQAALFYPFGHVLVGVDAALSVFTMVFQVVHFEARSFSQHRQSVLSRKGRNAPRAAI